MADTGFPEIYASAYLPKSSGYTKPLAVDEDNGALIIPKGVERVTGFFLEIEIPGHGLDVVLARKDVSTNGAGYHMEQIREVVPGHVWRTTTPIEVLTDLHTEERYTPWHKKFSNRIDIFVFRPGGETYLLQAGVVVRGKRGQETFYLLVEQLWHGHIVLNQKTGALVGVPAAPVWGSFESRRPIFNYEPFRRALKRSASGDVTVRVVEEDEVNPPLGDPPYGCYKVDWFVSFAGQRGQGIVKNSEGRAFWITCDQVLGQEDLEKLAARKIPTQHMKLLQPDPDGVIRFRRGMDIRSQGERSGFSKKDGPKYLQNIYLA